MSNLPSGLCALAATEASRLIASKKLSPVELITACLERIEAIQPELNPFCFVFADEALAQAREAEQAVLRGEKQGLLHGIPIAIKDFTPTKGKTTTRGSLIFKDWIPDFDPVLVQRLLSAGAIIIGKTTTPEFAYSSFTRSRLWGDTLNPWDKSRTSGGSSGGSAVAVATGCVALAEGTDMGGSVRIPAALCGIVGHKPSLGRIPMDILPTVFDSISHFGPLSRSVADAVLFMRVTEGPDDADIQSQIHPGKIPDPLNTDIAGLKIALSPDLGFYKVHADVQANLAAIAGDLRNAGARVEEVKFNWNIEVVEAWNAYWGVYLAAAFAEYLPEYREQMDPHVVDLMDAGLAMNAVAFKQLETTRTKQWLEFVRIMQGYDVLLCPTMAQPAPLAAKTDADFDVVDENGYLLGLDMTAPFNNIAQCPALSLPSGFSKDGLPTAVQIVGKRFDDATVFRVAAAIECLLG